MDYSIQTASSAIMATLCHMTQEQVAEVILEQQGSLLASELENTEGVEAPLGSAGMDSREIEVCP
jgi:hypothetical protein